MSPHRDPRLVRIGALVRSAAAQKQAGLIGVFAGALGLAWWCSGILLAGDAELAVFCPATVISVALLVFLVPGHPVSVSLPMGIVPLFSAPWTTPTGDNDGLWVAIFPILIFWIFALLLVAFGVQLLLSRNRGSRRPTSVRPTWVLGAEVFAIALTVAGAGWLQAVVVAGPWSDLRSQLSTYPVPAGFAAAGWAREGSARCSDPGCRPQVALTMRTTLDPTTACRTLKGSLRGWPGTITVSDDQPIGDWEQCVYFTSQRRAGATREVNATVEAASGRPTDVVVRLLADCALTC